VFVPLQISNISCLFLTCRTYWYLRETHRVQGRVKVKWQKYLGTADTILNKLKAAEQAKKKQKIKTEAFGALFVASVLEKELGTIDIIDEIVPRKAVHLRILFLRLGQPSRCSEKQAGFEALVPEDRDPAYSPC
jgi:hypothetical protein